jgi:flagellar biosynthesis protein FliP
MFDFLRINRKRKLDDLLNVENILQSSLKPVSPRPEFIQNLHKGLMEYSFPEQDSSEVDIKKAVLIATLGFASLVLMISVWVRLIVVIISALGILQTARQRKALKQ